MKSSGNKPLIFFFYPNNYHSNTVDYLRLCFAVLQLYNLRNKVTRAYSEHMKYFKINLYCNLSVFLHARFYINIFSHSKPLNIHWQISLSDARGWKTTAVTILPKEEWSRLPLMSVNVAIYLNESTRSYTLTAL